MAVQYIVAWGVIAILSASAASIIAGVKNRDHSFWSAWSFILPPAVIVLLLLPTLKGPPPRRPTLDEEDASRQ